jgi:hypothetical protein
VRDVRVGLCRCMKYESEQRHYDVHNLDVPQVVIFTARCMKTTAPHGSSVTLGCSTLEIFSK